MLKNICAIDISVVCIVVRKQWPVTQFVCIVFSMRWFYAKVLWCHSYLVFYLFGDPSVVFISILYSIVILTCRFGQEERESL